MNKMILLGAMIGGGALLPLAASAGDFKGEVVTAIQHADLSATAPDMGYTHMHLHHTVNCLVGPKGAGFDAKELNPCANSGNGAIPDAAGDAAKIKVMNEAVAKAQAGIAATDKATAQKDAADASALLKTIQ
jgi:hypothetical protein